MNRFLNIISLFIGSVLVTFQSVKAQQKDFNLTLLANVQIDFPDTIASQYKSYNDVWGWVAPDGTEYGIMGSGVGTSIFSLRDPSDPRLLLTVPCALSVWRDMKSYQNYIYVVAQEGEDGVLVIDMVQAPDSVTWSFWKPILDSGDEPTPVGLTCHNLYIDSGYAFLAGCQTGWGGGGVLIFDLAADPMSPPFLSLTEFRGPYAHDVYVKSDRLYTSNLDMGFSILDISDIAKPTTIARQSTTSNFTHNAWASDDGNFLFTTDERPGANVDAYDVSNPDEIMLLDTYRPSATKGHGVIPHNVHYHDGFLITSYYTDGIKIIDAHKPDNLVEVASYDTYFFRDGTFAGAWGAYPYLPSGLVLASDRTTGLYVLRPSYQRAAYVEGTVRDATSSDPLQGVHISFESERPGSTSSDRKGRFSTGIGDKGGQRLSFFKYGFHPKFVDLPLESADVLILDVELEPLQTFVVSGSVLDKETRLPLANASVLIQSGPNREDALSGSDGTFTLTVFEGASIGAAGKWGYLHTFKKIEIGENRSNVVLELNKGYRDDFMFDYGWTVNNPTLGPYYYHGWRRGEPGYTIYDAEFCNPNADIDNDFGNLCYVTGPEGKLSANLSDSSILQSPNFDLSSYADPYLNYFVWFYANGEDPLDDKMEVYLGKSNQEVLVESFADSRSGWRQRSSIRISDFMTPSEEMYLRIVAADEGNKHFYEAGLDGFSITEGFTTPLVEETTLDISIYPNPFSSSLIVESEGATIDHFLVRDVLGRQLYLGSVPPGGLLGGLDVLKPGMYLITLYADTRPVHSQRILKMQ